MISRDFENGDLPQILELCQRQGFNFPAMDSISSLGIVSDKGLVGVGCVRRIYEVVIALDETRSLKDRMTAIQLLMKKGLFESEKFGIKEWHAFVDDPRILRLMKHIGFKKIKGEGLILQW